jgi:transcriptional pleiotropic regulator of transition state genes
MKDTGMARKVDDLGRSVLPGEHRRVHGLQSGDALEICVDGDASVLLKLTPGSADCGTAEGLSTYRTRAVCGPCRSELTSPAAAAAASSSPAVPSANGAAAPPVPASVSG